VYEGGHRVPFIISWPDKFKHAVSDEPVISIDIMPTICAALNIKLPDDRIYDGKNILPAISTKLKQPLHDELYFDGNDGYWAVRQGALKLVYSKTGDLELYNLELDIAEQNNLVTKHPEKVNELKMKYERWRSEMGEPIRPNNNKKKK
jgi:arylsulfatase A-like enzyme